MAIFNRQSKKAGKAATDPGEPEGATVPAANSADSPAGTPPAVEAPIVEAALEPSAAEPVPGVEPDATEPPAAALNESLPLALEPELRKIIDTAVARVASIELEAIRESRQLTQRSEEEGREAMKYALDKSLQLVNSFELLTVTIAGMVSALRVELDAATAALHQVDDPYSHLTRELHPPKPALEETSIPEPDEIAPEGVQGMNGDSSELHTEPSPEMTEMFREQILNMKSTGKTREEAERTLLRFNLGRRFIGLLDEIYSEDSAEFAAAPAPEHRGRFVRRFFSRQ